MKTKIMTFSDVLWREGEPRNTRNTRKSEGGVETLKSGAQMSLSEVLSCRVRYLVDGGVIGSREFVRRIVNAERGRRLPANRKSEGNRTGMGGLFSLRKVG